MPIGILTDVSSVVLGGLLGCFLGERLTERWKSLLNNLLGMAAIVMGIVLILRVHNLSAAVLSMLVGGVAGEALQLEQNVQNGHQGPESVAGPSIGVHYLGAVDGAGRIKGGRAWNRY